MVTTWQPKPVTFSAQTIQLDGNDIEYKMQDGNTLSLLAKAIQAEIPGSDWKVICNDLAQTNFGITDVFSADPKVQKTLKSIPSDAEIKLGKYGQFFLTKYVEKKDASAALAALTGNPSEVANTGTMTSANRFSDTSVGYTGEKREGDIGGNEGGAVIESGANIADDETATGQPEITFIEPAKPTTGAQIINTDVLVYFKKPREGDELMLVDTPSQTTLAELTVALREAADREDLTVATNLQFLSETADMGHVAETNILAMVRGEMTPCDVLIQTYGLENGMTRYMQHDSQPPFPTDSQILKDIETFAHHPAADLNARYKNSVSNLKGFEVMARGLSREDAARMQEAKNTLDYETVYELYEQSAQAYAASRNKAPQTLTDDDHALIKARMDYSIAMAVGMESSDDLAMGAIRLTTQDAEDDLLADPPIDENGIDHPEQAVAMADNPLTLPPEPEEIAVLSPETGFKSTVFGRMYSEVAILWAFKSGQPAKQEGNRPEILDYSNAGDALVNMVGIDDTEQSSAVAQANYESQETTPPLFLDDTPVTEEQAEATALVILNSTVDPACAAVTYADATARQEAILSAGFNPAYFGTEPPVPDAVIATAIRTRKTQVLETHDLPAADWIDKPLAETAMALVAKQDLQGAAEILAFGTGAEAAGLPNIDPVTSHTIQTAYKSLTLDRDYYRLTQLYPEILYAFQAEPRQKIVETYSNMRSMLTRDDELNDPIPQNEYYGNYDMSKPSDRCTMYLALTRKEKMERS